MIIDLLNTYTKRNTVVSGFSVGTFVFDCALEESHESRLTVSENPLESGALVADHSYLEPKTYSVRGLIVSYKPQSLLQQTISNDLALAKRLPVLNGIIGQTEQVIARVNRYAGRVQQAAQTAMKIANRLAPWVPESLQSLGDQTQESLSRQAQAYADLLTIQANGEFLTITSGLRTYNNVLLTGVVCVGNEDDAAQFALEFREVFIVQTRTVQGLVVNVPSATPVTANKIDGEKKTGRAATQAAKPKSKGTSQPVRQPTTNKSVARSIGDLIRGL